MRRKTCLHSVVRLAKVGYFLLITGVLSGCLNTNDQLQSSLVHSGNEPLWEENSYSSFLETESNWSFRSAQTFIEKDAYFDGRQMSFVSRAAWGASAPTQSMARMNDVYGLVLHHTAGTGTVKSIQQFHQQSRKWSDIAYHFVIAPDSKNQWKIHEGRLLAYQGAHAGSRVLNGQTVNLNQGQIGIAVMGNFEKFSPDNPGGFSSKTKEYQQQPKKIVVQLLGNLIDHLEKRFPGVRHLFGHGQDPYAINPGHTTCPGIGQIHLIDSFLKRFGMSADYDLTWIFGNTLASNGVSSLSEALSTNSSLQALQNFKVDLYQQIAQSLFIQYLKAFQNQSVSELEKVVSPLFFELSGGKESWQSKLESLSGEPPTSQALNIHVKPFTESDEESNSTRFYASYGGSWFLIRYEDNQWRIEGVASENVTELE